MKQILEILRNELLDVQNQSASSYVIIKKKKMLVSIPGALNKVQWSCAVSLVSKSSDCPGKGNEILSELVFVGLSFI